MIHPPLPTLDYVALASQIKAWGRELGLQQVGITDTDLGVAERRLTAWLQQDRHGEMAFMARHGSRRSRPAELLPGTLRVISVRLEHLPQPVSGQVIQQNDPTAAYIARYALGRDYHKLLRRRLQQLAERIKAVTGPFGYRAFVDSAPVLEKPLAEKAGLGWIGKHTNLVNRQAGSWFFLGELYTDLPLPIDRPATNHCGSCRACLDICPTHALIAPYQLDARRCISYLTIELQGSIPETLRPLIGNRIFGCDDCQRVCPWNRYAQLTAEINFQPRHGLDQRTLVELFAWSEGEFLQRTEGSALRRLGWTGWLRNIAVALGNAPTEPCLIAALKTRANHPDALVQEHVRWALAQ
jgi:epoxyqueuosine reductase